MIFNIYPKSFLLFESKPIMWKGYELLRFPAILLWTIFWLLPIGNDNCDSQKGCLHPILHPFCSFVDIYLNQWTLHPLLAGSGPKTSLRYAKYDYTNCTSRNLGFYPWNFPTHSEVYNVNYISVIFFGKTKRCSLTRIKTLGIHGTYYEGL